MGAGGAQRPSTGVYWRILAYTGAARPATGAYWRLLGAAGGCQKPPRGRQVGINASGGWKEGVEGPTEDGPNTHKYMCCAVGSDGSPATFQHLWWTAIATKVILSCLVGLTSTWEAFEARRCGRAGRQGGPTGAPRRARWPTKGFHSLPQLTQGTRQVVSHPWIAA